MICRGRRAFRWSSCRWRRCAISNNRQGGAVTDLDGDLGAFSVERVKQRAPLFKKQGAVFIVVGDEDLHGFAGGKNVAAQSVRRISVGPGDRSGIGKWRLDREAKQSFEDNCVPNQEFGNEGEMEKDGMLTSEHELATRREIEVGSRSEAELRRQWRSQTGVWERGGTPGA